MVQHEHPHRPAPQQAGEAARQRAADRVSEPERRGETAERPDEERAIHERHDRIGEQIGRVALARAALGVNEQPADVRVREPAQRPAQADAVIDVGAVRIALAIGERVVLAMVGDPGDDGPLDRGRPEHGQTPRSAGEVLKLRWVNSR